MNKQKTIPELVEMERQLSSRYFDLQNQGLQLDLTRGKPSPEQLDLANLLDRDLNNDYLSPDNIDVRNYGQLEGLPSARQLGASLLGVQDTDIIVGGNASLTLMYQYLLSALYWGPLGRNTAWKRNNEHLKFLCVVPGYDRHFTITEDLGFEMINVEMLESGPNMDAVEQLVAADPQIKGIWCVPKYQNPTGHTFSDETVERMSLLGKIAGPDFRIMWDNAYAVHDLYDSSRVLKNIMDCCKTANTQDSVIMFASTSKITRAGSGISFIAASPDNLSHFKKRLSVQTIGSNKVNQLRHVRFLRNFDGIESLMQQHAAIVRPKFEKVIHYLQSHLKDIATWTEPRGGYFLSVNVASGSAKDVVRLAGEAGVKLTPAGATFPYKLDPADINIRLAPTYPNLDELQAAMPVFVTAVQLASVRKLLIQEDKA